MSKTSEAIEIIGCGAPEGNYCPRCAGGWPGTRATTIQLTIAAEKGKLNPDKLGCETLRQRAKEFLEARYRQ